MQLNYRHRLRIKQHKKLNISQKKGSLRDLRSKLTDESDKEEAQNVVNEFQKTLNPEKKGILDRETERLVQNENDELELEISQS